MTALATASAPSGTVTFHTEKPAPFYFFGDPKQSAHLIVEARHRAWAWAEGVTQALPRSLAYAFMPDDKTWTGDVIVCVVPPDALGFTRRVSEWGRPW